jgi:anti-anti-sigma factor
MGISFVVDGGGKSLTIKISERFDFSQHQAFRNAYEGLDLTQARIILDMSGLEYMDSSALGMLLVLRERAGGDQANITLKGVRQNLMQIIEVSRFHELFKLQ